MRGLCAIGGIQEDHPLHPVVTRRRQAYLRGNGLRARWAGEALGLRCQGSCGDLGARSLSLRRQQERPLKAALSLCDYDPTVLAATTPDAGTGTETRGVLTLAHNDAYLRKTENAETEATMKPRVPSR